MLFKALFFAFFCGGGFLLAEDVICQQKDGFESTISFDGSGNIICRYASAVNPEAGYTVKSQGITKEAALESAIAEVIRNGDGMNKFKASEQRLEAMKRILRSLGKDPNQAQAQLDLLKNDSDATIAEALASANSGLGAGDINTINQEERTELEKRLDSIEADIHGGQLEFATVPVKIDSHTEYKKTFPSILSGVLTLDPEYFDNAGGVRYVNDIGEVLVNNDLLKSYVYGGNGDSAFEKFADPIKEALGLESGAAVSFDMMDFTDKQLLGFYVYLTANLGSFYSAFVGMFFMLGVGGMTAYAFSRYYFANYASRYSTILSGWGKKGARPGEWSRRAASEAKISPFYAAAVGHIGVLVFFMAPVFKDDVAVGPNSAIEKTAYHEGAASSSDNFGYSTAAQELIRYTVGWSNYLGNLINDYAMHSYSVLLQNKMGALEDVLPRFITETKAELAEIDRDKQLLASKADLFNKGCRPYYKDGKFMIPEKASAPTSSATAIIVGDSFAEKIAEAMKNNGANVTAMTASGNTVSSVLPKAEAAGAATADVILLSAGHEALKQGSYGGIPLELEGWKEKYAADLTQAYIAASEGGKKVYCIAPYSQMNEATAGASKEMMTIAKGICTNTIPLKVLADGQMDSSKMPTAAGFDAIGKDLNAKTVTKKADFVDAATCQSLLLQIKEGQKEISRKTDAVVTKTNDAEGYVANITKNTSSRESGKYMNTTDPTKVFGKYKNIKDGDGNNEVWSLRNGSFGYFKLPQSSEQPGWQATVRISEYGVKDKHGKYEKGTGEYTATGEKMSSMEGKFAFTAANWHLPLNTMLEVTFPQGQKLYFRTADRGPVVKYKQSYAPGQKVTKNTNDIAPPNRPHTTSDRFIDLPAQVANKLCAKTDSWVTVRVLYYNASRTNPPQQPGMDPNGGIKIDPSKCKNISAPVVDGDPMTGGGFDIENGGEPYVLIVDDSPVRVLRDYVNLTQDIANTFGWVSAITVPTSYEFYKYVNLFFVNNAEISSNPDDDMFSKEMMAQYNNGEEDNNYIAKVFEHIVGDVLVKNAMYFVVPGFSKIQEAIAGQLERFTLIKQSDLDVEPALNASSTIKKIAVGAVGMMLGGTMGAGGDTLNTLVNSILGAVTGLALFSGNAQLVGLAIGVISMVIAIAIVTIVISTMGIMLMSAVLVIQTIVFFVEVAAFFIFSPFIGLVAAFRMQSGPFLGMFLKRLVAILIMPILIIMPAYLFIPISEIFRATMTAMSSVGITIMQAGETALGGSVLERGLFDSTKALIARSAIGGLIEIFTVIATIFVILIVFIKFKSWVYGMLMLKETASVTDDSIMGEAKGSIQKYVAPV